MVALLKIKLSKLSNIKRKPQSDTDLIRALGNLKDEKQIESQKELYQIKEVKRNLCEQLLKIYLPIGFCDFFGHVSTLGFYDKPDYDKLIKILEKSRDSIPFYAKSKSNTIVDTEVKL